MSRLALCALFIPVAACAPDDRVGPSSDPPAALDAGADSAPPGPAPRVDLDGDGRTDLVVAALGQVDVHLGADLALGSTAPRQRIRARYQSLHVLPDADGDGRDELIVRGFDTIEVYPGREGGLGDPVALSCGGCQRWVSVADVNGDGLGDAILSGSLDTAIHLGSPAGVSTDPSTTVEGALLGAGDLDGDGRDELVGTGLGGGFVWARFADPSWDVSALPEPDSELERDLLSLVGRRVDIDGDGLGDLVGMIGGHSLVVWRGAPGGLRVEAPRLLGGSAAWGRCLDFDGDGRDDVVVAHHANFVMEVWTGSPSGLRAPRTMNLYVDGSGYVWPVGDVDGDGDEEMLATGSPTQVILGGFGEIAEIGATFGRSYEVAAEAP